MISKKTHPKSFDLYKTYLKTAMINNSKGKNVPDELLQSVLSENIIELSMGKNPRGFYDFLDDQNIIVSVWKPGDFWNYRVEDKLPMEGSGRSRKECEEKAFLEAFNRLERKI